jgi:predicted metal-dependent HD superfamily phosphohydrolase
MSSKKYFIKLIEKSVEIAKTYGFEISIEEALEKWSEPHRYWHVINHLIDMIEGIDELFKENKISEKEYHILIIAAIFHDIVYDPKRNDNEEKSVEYMLSTFKGDMNGDVEKIIEIILDTKTHDSKNGITKKFNKLDTCILDAPFIDMLDWENKIYNEYKWAGWKQYKKGRIKFLLSSIQSHPHNVLNIKNLIDYVEKKEPKVGICYYEIDKLPPINEFIINNNRINSLFDIITVVIVYNKDNYDKNKIKEYGVCSDYEFVALSEDSFIGFFNKQSGNVFVVKDMKLVGEYNKDIDSQIKEKNKFFYG